MGRFAAIAGGRTLRRRGPKAPPIRVHENRLLVEVIDEGSGFERVARDHDVDQLGGLGLRIVDAEASRWGVHEGTTHVWFEIERSGPRLGAEPKPLPDPAD
jgi:hypothetical protein